MMIKQNTLVSDLESIAQFVGNTPLKKVAFPHADLYVKLEYCNYSGSIKDRAALNVIRHGILQGHIGPETVIVESSSGNFAIALASICRKLGLKFIPVIDPNINKAYEELLGLLAPAMVKVQQIDNTGGYLLTRISTVQEICATDCRAFWTNQYGNPENYLAYYHGLGVEICEAFDRLDYLFIGVSSGGTITGVSRRVKEKFPAIQVIAVDVEGSVIFGQKPQKRYVSGIGSSKVPPILADALIDDVVFVSQADIVRGCYDLLDELSIFGGASSGAVYAAIKTYLGRKAARRTPTALFLCPDRGNAYLDTIYNGEWQKNLFDLALADETVQPAPAPEFSL
jgi:cysteine synthase A